MNTKQIKTNTAFATIELLIAFSILVINITGVLLLTDGTDSLDNHKGSGYVISQGQNVAVNSETSQEALYKAKQLIEDKKVQAQSDFFSVTSYSAPINDVSGPLTYIKDFNVSDLTPCKKEITSSVSWNQSSLRPQSIKFSTLLTDISGALALGGDCPTDSPGEEDWRKPLDLDYSGASLKTEGYGKAIDVQNKIAFLVTKASGNNKDDFYIFDTSDINDPIKKSSLDISDGLEDIDVANNFAFIANDENTEEDQLAIVDISDLESPGTPVFASLPGVTGECPYTCPGGRSIYYYQDRVYIGTHRLVAGGAAEFHVFDVANPTVPVWMGSIGGVSLGDAVDHDINEIVVREQLVGGVSKTYAYLATSNDSGELTILNVTNPASIPDPAGTPDTGVIFNLPGTGTGENLDATSLFISGNRAYVGRQRATGNTNDFFVIDISTPTSPVIIGETNLELNSNGSSIVGIQVLSKLALVATTDPNKPFLVLDLSDLGNIERWDILDCAVDFSTHPTGIDYDNNLIYLPLHNASSNINLKIIKPTGGSCS